MNLIAHYSEGGSDKVYLACVRAESGGRFSVIGKWGRRGKAFSQQTKGTYSSLVAANMAAKEVFGEKLRKGYVDIKSPSYSGPVTVTSVREYLEPEADSPAPKANPNPVIQVELDPVKLLMQAQKAGKTLVAKCTDNTGMGDSFDVGVEYVINIEITNEGKVFCAFDNYGKKIPCYPTRFGAVRVEE